MTTRPRRTTPVEMFREIYLRIRRLEAVNNALKSCGFNSSGSPFPGMALVETLMLDTRLASPGAAMATVLEEGQLYKLLIDGTFDIWDQNLNTGAPEANAMYPTAPPRASGFTEVGFDADTEFGSCSGCDSGPYPKHWSSFQMNYGDGLGMIHREPVGGPFSAPEPGHLYEYTVVGQGAAISAWYNDGAFNADNYGYLRMRLYGRTVAPDGSVPTADGSCGVAFAYPTIEVDGDRYDEILLGTNLNGTPSGDAITIDAAGGSGIPLDGWVDDTAAVWTRTSNTTFTTPGDRTAFFRVGRKLRWKDGGAYKYAVIVSSAHAAGTTTVTFTGGSDYVMAAATITDNYYSLVEDPEGWPGWFNYTPAWTGFSVNPTLSVARFCVVGRICTVTIRGSANGTSNATTFTLTGPIAAAVNSNLEMNRGVDNGVNIFVLPTMAAASNVITVTPWTAGAWTASGNKSFQGTFSYGI